jgi:hypothetical protein
MHPRIVGYGIVWLFGGWVHIEDHVAWGRDFPVKYLLVREDEEGEEEFWGRCVGVEGYGRGIGRARRLLRP